MISVFLTIVVTMTVLTLHVVWFVHIYILHDDKWTKSKCIIENDIILFTIVIRMTVLTMLVMFGLPIYIFSP